MRKSLLMSIFSLWTFTSFAQISIGEAEIGIKLSPALSVNRVSTESDTLTFSNDGSGVRFVFGLVLDLPLTEKYYISTGLIYAPKRVAVNLTDLTQLEAYKAQYLQIPVTMKLFTDELFLDTRLYFQLGLLGEFKVADKSEDNANNLIEGFRAFDTSVLLGAGVERNFGVGNVWFAGFSYTRGLINAASSTNPALADFAVKNDLFQLDLGIKF